MGINGVTDYLQWRILIPVTGHLISRWLILVMSVNYSAGPKARHHIMQPMIMRFAGVF